MKIVIPAEKLAAAINKHLIPALVRKQLSDQKKKLDEDQLDKKQD